MVQPPRAAEKLLRAQPASGLAGAQAELRQYPWGRGVRWE